jgi:ectoine hydroxylase-related dioxygenase (phytanoyl-CoA dioxygenase family)
LCGDENPPHKDTWSSTGLGTINIYVPIAGSDENSSLSLIPGSHFWNESDIKKINPGDAIISTKKYSVGGAVESKFGLNMIRPNPASDEFLIFTPHLLHGGAKNFNINHTRFSIEMRFQRAGKLRKFIV